MKFDFQLEMTGLDWDQRLRRRLNYWHADLG
jgi:hypothetical protein